ncbi:MAG: DUF6268 family outer membrane beta-barrel protein [Bacteroidia bacterium]
MKQNLTLLFILSSYFCFSQPFFDPINFSSQFFSSAYKDSAHTKNQTNDYVLNAFFPKKLSERTTLLIRLTGENLHSEYKSTTTISSNLYAISMPLGAQFLTKNEKWKVLAMAIPKISSDFKDNLNNDLQLGGIALFSYVKSKTLQFKLGLYYNREFFGNFFVPLIGIDWKATERLSFYGVFTTNYYVEYKWGNKFFTGIFFKAYERSYRLSNYYNNDFVWVKEDLVKFFANYFIYKKIILFAEISRSIGYSLLEYKNSASKTRVNTNPVYTSFNDSFLFSVGIAYRIRMQ